MIKKIEDETKIVVNSLLRINDAAKEAIIDSVKRDEQSKRIENLVQEFGIGFNLEKAYGLTKESFGGSFGMLPEDSKLLLELRKHNELVKQLSMSIKNKIVFEILVDQKFHSNPLVEFEERHGGPLWFDLSVFTLEFKSEKIVEITIDKSLSKKPIKVSNELKVISCEYYTVVVKPNYITGQIVFEDGRKFHFETLYGKMEYICLEHPQFWKESIVVTKIPKIEN